MDILSFSKFLTDGKVKVPPGYIAVAIHPSSDADICDVNGVLLGVGGIAPVPVESGTNVLALRNPLTAAQVQGAFTTALDGNLGAGGGDKLVLQCFRECDALLPPGPRLPRYQDVIVPSGSIGATAATACLAMRVPFHGRAALALAFRRTTNAADLSVLVVGRSYGSPRGSSLIAGINGVWHELTTETWRNGGGAAATALTVDATVTAGRWRQVVVGGEADMSECFDEICVYIWGAAGGDAWLTAEAYGERVS